MSLIQTSRISARGDRPGVNLAQGFHDFPARSAMKYAIKGAPQREITVARGATEAMLAVVNPG